MLRSNEFIALTYQQEARRQVQQARLAREAQSGSPTHLFKQIVSGSKALWATFARRASYRLAPPSRSIRHAR